MNYEQSGLAVELKRGHSIESTLRILGALQTKSERSLGETVYLNTWGFDQDDAKVLEPYVERAERGEALDHMERMAIGARLVKYANQIERLEGQALNDNLAPMLQRAVEVMLDENHDVSGMVTKAKNRGWTKAQTVDWAQAHGFTAEELERIGKLFEPKPEPIPAPRRTLGGGGLTF